MRVAKSMTLLRASWLDPLATGLRMAKRMAFQMASCLNPEMCLEA